MNNSLPKTHADSVTLFPNNHRFIPDYIFSNTQSHYVKVILVSFVSLFLLTLIFLQGVTLWDNVKQSQALVSNRVQLQNEITYWEQIANKYQGYRDVYYRIAALQYKLGNTGLSQQYVKKAIQLDPNYPEGHVLGMHVGL